MNYEFVDDFGNTWITDSALASGPYLNMSSVGEANVRWFKERKDNYITHEVGWDITISHEKKRVNFNMEADALKETDFIIVEGDDRMIFVNKDTPHVSLVEEVFGLEDYPCIDDEMVDKVEEEWYHEGWHVYLFDEVRLECRKQGLGLDELLDQNDVEYAYDEILREELFKIFNKTLEECNVEPYCEGYNVINVDMRKVAKPFYENVSKELNDEPNETLR